MYEEYFDEELSQSLQDLGAGEHVESFITVYTSFLTETFDDLTRNVWVEALITVKKYPKKTLQNPLETKRL